MKSRELHALILTAFLVLFASLLVSGAPRLIASAEDLPPPVCTVPVQAYLCSAASSTGQVECEAGGQRADASRRMEAALYCAHLSAKRLAAPGSDANGNVLCAVTYMRSVYQSFALGDGFA